MSEDRFLGPEALLLACAAAGQGLTGIQPTGPRESDCWLYSVCKAERSKVWHTQGTDLSQGKWRAWRDSNPRPMASEATTLSG
jgi:hypothetical protein